MLILTSTWTVLNTFGEKKLPDRECFYSSVKDRITGDNGEKLDGHISNHDHYLKKSVLLLADVFEKFIDACLKFYKVDPCHYFSSPGLCWDAM